MSIMRVVKFTSVGKTYQKQLLKKLLIDIGWEEDDMQRLKLIK